MRFFGLRIANAKSASLQRISIEFRITVESIIITIVETNSDIIF